MSFSRRFKYCTHLCYNIYYYCKLYHAAALEMLCAKKDEELASKNRQIETLQRKMRHMRETHKQELEELQLKIQQELYVAQTLNNSKVATAARKKTSKRKQ